jgi:hypothetical protein
MQNRSFFVATLVLAGLIVSGCAQAPSQAPLPIRPQAVVQTPSPLYAYPLAAPPGMAEKVAWGRLPEGPVRDQARAEAQQLFRVGARQGYDLSDAFIEQEQTNSVEEALVSTRARLQLLAGTPHQSYAEQVLATRLLNHYLAQNRLTQVAPTILAQQKLTSAQQQVVGFATELLIRNGSPNADLLAATLTTLKGYWTDVQIAASARQAIATAQAWLAERTPCDTCAAKDGPIDAGLRLQQVAAGITDLQGLAGS